MYIRLKSLNTASAFIYNNITYLTVGLTSDKSKVICINTTSKIIECLDGENIVKEIRDWYVSEFFKSSFIITGNELKTIDF